MRVFILVQPGFWTLANETSGLWPFYLPLKERYEVDGSTVLFKVWNTQDLKALAAIAKDADYIIHVGHSFGVGFGQVTFAQELKHYKRYIDLAVAIDPVPYLGEHFRCTNAPFPNYPINVTEVLLVRTLNKPGMLYPWGRDIIAPSVFNRIIFGPPLHDLSEVGPYTFYYPDTTVYHNNIDGNPIVHEALLQAIEERIGIGA